MEILKKTLSDIDGGCVLDVATHQGGFIQLLIQYLKSYSEIVGIDIDEQYIETARDELGGEDVRFQVMDAEHLAFKDERFDMVAISASLHHLTNIPHVLQEMKRVLRPGGYFLIVEMHRDAKTEASLTSVYIHEWAAEIDTALMRVHNHTLFRQELVSYAEDLGLSSLAYYDNDDYNSDPMDRKRIVQLEGAIERNSRRIEKISSKARHKRRGELLRRRLYHVGAQDEPRILIVGKK